MDTRTKEQRTKIMQAVRSQNTGPEMLVRKLVYGMGYRYRLYRKELPGKPDLVFGRRKKVIFVHGCFWHGHGCRIGKAPKSSLNFWLPKLRRNQERDKSNEEKLGTLGWIAMVIWQCEIMDLNGVKDKISSFLEGGVETNKVRKT